MRLHEIDHEFKNEKPSTTEDNLKFAQQRVSSIHHHIELAKHKLESFRDRFVQYRYSKPTDAEIAKGFSFFEMGNDGGKWAVYHSLTPQEVPIVASLWKKVEDSQPRLKKAQQTVSRFKLQINKANGTYISQQEVNKCEFDFQKEIMKLVETTIGSNYRTYARGTRTKKNGMSRVTISINLAPGSAIHTSPLNAFKKQITTAIKVWLETNGFDETRMRVSFFVKMNSSIIGLVEVRVQTADLIKRYHKK